jgi:hypothetical protein
VSAAYVAYDEAHRKNESPQANLLGFDSLGRKKVDALCNAVEPQAYNRKGNGPTDNHECDVFGRAYFPVHITPWLFTLEEFPPLQHWALPLSDLSAKYLQSGIRLLPGRL